jgi:hypothetical protein
MLAVANGSALDGLSRLVHELTFVHVGFICFAEIDILAKIPEVRQLVVTNASNEVSIRDLRPAYANKVEVSCCEAASDPSQVLLDLKLGFLIIENVLGEIRT